MIANFDVLGPAAGAAPGAADRKNVEARQQQWLFELERATMSFGGGKSEQQGGEQSGTAAQDPDTQANIVRAAAAAKKADRAEGAAAALGATVPSAAPSQAAPGAPVAAPTNAAPAATPSLGAKASVPDAAPAQLPAKPVAAGASMAASDAVDGMSAQRVQSMFQNPALGALMLASSTAASQTAQLGETGPGEIAARLAPTAAPSLAAAVGLPGALAQAEVGAEAAPMAEEAPADSGAASAKADEREAYQQTQLHLYHGADGVQAWIRDAAVNESQAQAMVATMRDELGAIGSKLSALTVNGRKVIGATTDALLDEQLQEPQAQEDDAVPSPHAHPIIYQYGAL